MHLRATADPENSNLAVRRELRRRVRAPVHFGCDFLFRCEQAGVGKDTGGSAGGGEGCPGGEDVVGRRAAGGVEEGDDGV